MDISQTINVRSVVAKDNDESTADGKPIYPSSVRFFERRLSLMKGDKVVDVPKEVSDFHLFINIRIRNLKITYLFQ